MLIPPVGSLAFPLIVTALVPDVAGACPGYYDPCEGLEGWTHLEPHNADKIPTDGVLVLQGGRVGGGDPFAGVALEVTKDGQPIAGALETTPNPGVLIWRPTDPWEAGATYALAGTITNPVGFDACFAPEVPIAGQLAIDTVPAAALVAPEFTGETMVNLNAIISLSTIACCEGAPTPSEDYGGCGGGNYVNFDPEQCAAVVGQGFFSLAITGQPAAEGAAAQQILYTLKIDGNAQSSALAPGASFGNLGQPICIAFDALDLASGTLASGSEQCFGADFADQLGQQPIDPDLACPLEQCAVTNMMWDPTMCQPFNPGPGSDSDTPTSSDTDPGSGSEGSGSSDTDPDQDGDKACACTDAPDAPPALLALATLLALPRRRTR